MNGLKLSSHGAIFQRHSYFFSNPYKQNNEEKLVAEVITDPFWVEEVNPPLFDRGVKTIKEHRPIFDGYSRVRDSTIIKVLNDIREEFLRIWSK